jgi:hypothetical protein
VRSFATDALRAAKEKTPHSMVPCGESAFKGYGLEKVDSFTIPNLFLSGEIR